MARRPQAQPQIDGHWHLDRRVPIALIIALAIQTTGVIYRFGQLDERIKNLEETANTQRPVPERIARLEEKVDGMKSVLTRIDLRMDNWKNAGTPGPKARMLGAPSR